MFAANTLLAAHGIDAFIRKNSPKQAVVIGGGYIGLETAEALRDRGLDVTVLQRDARILRAFDDEVTSRVESALHARVISLRKGAAALAITDGEVASGCRRRVAAQLVVIASGHAAECGDGRCTAGVSLLERRARSRRTIACRRTWRRYTRRGIARRRCTW